MPFTRTGTPLRFVPAGEGHVIEYKVDEWRKKLWKSGSLPKSKKRDRNKVWILHPSSSLHIKQEMLSADRLAFIDSLLGKRRQVEL